MLSYLPKSHSRLAMVCVLWPVFFPSTVIAEDDLEPHFAFSTYFGSGIYNSTGRDVTIFNVPLAFSPDWEGFKSLENARIRVPLSLGFSNFDYERIKDTQLDQDAATISIGVGLEKNYWNSPKQKLVPFFDVGYSEDLYENKGAITYALGTSLFRYKMIWGEPQTLFAKVQHAGFSRIKNKNDQNFSSIQLGGDFKLPSRIPLGRYTSFISSYLTSYFFIVGIDFEETRTSTLQDEWIHEVGITWGLDKPIETAVINIERLGLGYRFSEKGNHLLHLTFNFPLD